MLRLSKWKKDRIVVADIIFGDLVLANVVVGSIFRLLTVVVDGVTRETVAVIIRLSTHPRSSLRVRRSGEYYFELQCWPHSSQKRLATSETMSYHPQ